DKLTRIGKSLLKKCTLPIIKQREDTLRQIVSPYFWSNEVTVVSLEKVRVEIRELIKLIEKEQRKIVYTDLNDELIEVSTELKEVITTYTSSESYKQRVETYVRDNQHDTVIQKIKQNIPITQRDMEMLEHILFDGNERGTKEDFVRVYGDKPLGYFIRSIVGLDSRAANDAFSAFLQAGNLSANQNQFMATIIKFLTTDGMIDPGMLFEDPFTRIDSGGVFGVFGEEKASEIIYIIKQINQNAAA
ncbi:MAG: type I restriction-modification enzyme R subunit C-terminal domain-containing protein, partial [Phocaeicola sp.]